MSISREQTGLREAKVVTDADMVQFELRWFELGGGSAEEIRERFGVEPVAFFAHVHDILDREPPPAVSRYAIEGMKRVARARQWLAA
ncbi:DUF3263 domain-containing protein [Aldersonia sp. NBC_00410]|uniref:DUF3263 domain-containing protein n=1 Tax=Aldersonia sp. NBC_00410 TaxID=2975954 RepID=UPI00225AA060|nr:DUF3263 domain-containing protein [Aldersonia sp. NBC_00410]MCX5044107.1 DUF3263 domain-containing protein [Aldersonia sp. NBC_00410]